MNEPAWDDAWVTALASMEVELEQAQAMLALDRVFEETTIDPWRPPSNLGPLPAHLVERARTLLARQLDVSRQLADAARMSRRHERAVTRLHGGSASPPVYLDTPA